MKILPPQPRWISAEDGNPAYGKIAGIDHSPKDGYVLIICLENGEDRRMSLWGRNLATAMRVLGSESDNWLGKRFSCAFEENSEGKTIRTASFS